MTGADVLRYSGSNFNCAESGHQRTGVVTVTGAVVGLLLPLQTKLQ